MRILLQCPFPKLQSTSSKAVVRIGARREILDRISAKIKFDGAIYFVDSTNEQAIRSLLDRKVEIGILHEVPDTAELIAKPLFREDFRLVVPNWLGRSTFVPGVK